LRLWGPGAERDGGRRAGPTRAAGEFATLKWGDWFNIRHLPVSIRHIPPTEVEARYHAQAAVIATVAWLSP
jgi:hypothetical protein